MNYLSSLLATTGISLLTLGAFSASAIPSKIAQSSDINVNGPTVDCKDVRASSPGVGVSVPNVSRLVPNVGKILRKGVGVPAPDTEAPDVSTPKVSASAPYKTCSNVRTNNRATPASTSTDTSTDTNTNSGSGTSESVRGLW
jgi:hypothetical protein